MLQLFFEDKGDYLEQIQTISTFGKDPRDFNLNKDNTLAIATNETKWYYKCL